LNQKLAWFDALEINLW
jgi:hypothetical protein